MACTVYHEKPSVFPGGMPVITRLKISFMWKMNTGNTEIFLMRAK